MQTIPNEISGGRRRRIHSDEFKAQIVAACSVPGVSTAAVAMAHGINPNLARRWVHAAERCAGVALRKAAPNPNPNPKPSTFVPVQLAAPVSASFPDTLTAHASHASPASVAVAPADIRIELRRGPLAISVSWPSAAAPQCAAWLSELLR
jgi:transposase